MKDRLVNRVTIKFAIMLIVAVIILLTALGTTTTILLNRLPAATAPAVPQHTSMVLAGELQRPYSCRLLDDAERQCAFGQCDARLLERLRRECLRDGGRP
jgi:hypothetical protein